MTTTLVTALAEAPLVRETRRAGVRGVSVDPQREYLARTMYQDAASRLGDPAWPWERLDDVQRTEWLLRADAARAALSTTPPLSEATLEAAIAQYIDQDARLFALTAGMTLAAFEAGFPGLRDRVAARAATVIVKQLRSVEPGPAMVSVEVIVCASCELERPMSWVDDDGEAYCESCVNSIIGRLHREGARSARGTGGAHLPPPESRLAPASSLSIRDGWLVTGDCTCTARAQHTEAHGHECGYTPVAQLAALPGWREMVSKHALSVLGEVDTAIEKVVTKLFGQHSLSAPTGPGEPSVARGERS